MRKTKQEWIQGLSEPTSLPMLPLIPVIGMGLCSTLICPILGRTVAIPLSFLLGKRQGRVFFWNSSHALQCWPGWLLALEAFALLFCNTPPPPVTFKQVFWVTPPHFQLSSCSSPGKRVKLSHSCYIFHLLLLVPSPGRLSLYWDRWRCSWKYIEWENRV